MLVNPACFLHTSSSWPESASLPFTLKLGMQDQAKSLPGIESVGGFQCSGQNCRTHYYVRQLREAGQSLQARPPEQVQPTQTPSGYFCGCPCWVCGMGCPFWGLRSPPADHSSLPMNQQILA
eukprot:1147653-Pelagomonas_calceolata.AAC.3